MGDLVPLRQSRGMIIEVDAFYTEPGSTIQNRYKARQWIDRGEVVEVLEAAKGVPLKCILTMKSQKQLLCYTPFEKVLRLLNHSLTQEEPVPIEEDSPF